MNPTNLPWWMGLPTDPLSHAGLSVAAAFAVHQLLRQLFRTLRKREQCFPRQLDSSPEGGWNIDYRLVIIGALLPDLIDKSLQLWFFPEVFDLPGRSLAHSLVFNSILVTYSLLLLPFSRSMGTLVFSLASAGHLLFDRMWESPETLFWPLYGLSYGHAENKLSPWWLDWAQSGISSKILDLTGALVLLVFFTVIIRRKSLLKWIRNGVASFCNSCCNSGGFCR